MSQDEGGIKLAGPPAKLEEIKKKITKTFNFIA
jgi:hypothetical protein